LDIKYKAILIGAVFLVVSTVKILFFHSSKNWTSTRELKDSTTKMHKTPLSLPWKYQKLVKVQEKNVLWVLCVVFARFSKP